MAVDVTPRRYPIEPLLELLAEQGVSLHKATEILGMSGSNLKAARTRGLLVKAADRCALRAGFHPAEVWPSWVEDALVEAMKPCEACGEAFLPARRNVRFCSQRCRRLVQQRRYRQRPEVQERNRAARRAAYRQTAEYERARQRRYYAENRERIQARRTARASKSDPCSSAVPATTVAPETSAPGAARTAPELVNPWSEESTMVERMCSPVTDEAEAA